MLNLLQNNETAKNLGSLPLLTNNPICKGDSVMAKPTLSKPKRTCQVEGCNRACRAKGYCVRHYTQIRNHGKISGNPKKLKYGEPNRYIFEDNICKIELYDAEGNIKDYAIIDAEDFNRVKNIKWGIDSEDYVYFSRRNGKNLKLHRVVLGLSKGDKNIDHEDGNPLNNRKSNLRICNKTQNACNRGPQKNNTSGYKGVYWHKAHKKWMAVIQVNGKRKFLGYYESKINAAKAYNQGAKQYHGEFARGNLIEKERI